MKSEEITEADDDEFAVFILYFIENSIRSKAVDFF